MKGLNSKKERSKIFLILIISVTVAFLMATSETVKSYGEPCTADSNCSQCEQCNLTTLTCDYIPLGNPDNEPTHLCSGSNGCLSNDCLCNGTGFCKSNVGQVCSASSECLYDKCILDPNDTISYCIPSDKECVYDLQGNGTYYDQGNNVNWSCVAENTSGDCSSLTHTCLATGEWQCSSQASPCAYCINDTAFNGYCDDTTANNNQVEACVATSSDCAVCTECIDNGTSTLCELRAAFTYDTVTPYQCTASGVGCNATSCICDGSGVCGYDNGAACGTDSDCASNKCRYDPEDNTSYCIPAAYDCVFNLTGSGGYFIAEQEAVWPCTDIGVSGDCSSENVTCRADGNWECSSSYWNNSCAFCSSDAPYNGTCEDTILNNQELESCNATSSGVCGICQECVDQGIASSCNSITCSEDTAGTLCYNSYVCGDDSVCYSKLSGGEQCNNLSGYNETPNLDTCAPADYFCLSGVCCSDGLCRNESYAGCCYDSDCYPMDSCSNTTKSCFVDYGLGDEFVLAQSFTTGFFGFLMGVNVSLKYSTGSANEITLEVRPDNGGFPGNTVLASSSLRGFTNTSFNWKSFVFLEPPLLDNNTQYYLILKCNDCNNNKTYKWQFGDDGYSKGSVYYSTDSGLTWNINTSKDFYFETYMAEAVVDQNHSNTLVLNQSFGWNKVIAQSFTPSMTGRLGFVDVYIKKNRGKAGGIEAMIHNPDPTTGVPAEAIAFSGILPVEETEYTLKRFFFMNSNVVLEASKKYFISFHSCTSEFRDTYSVLASPDLYVNGSFFNQSDFSVDCINGEPIMENNALIQQLDRLSNLTKNRLHIIANFSWSKPLLFQNNYTGPWRVGLNITINHSIDAGVVSFNGTTPISVDFDITELYDPLFFIYTNRSYSRKFKPTNITEWNLESFQDFLQEGKYKKEEKAPSFLMRFENKSNNGSVCCGAETIVPAKVVELLGNKNWSYVGYCFWNNNCSISEYGGLYNITNVTNNTYRFKLDLYHTSPAKYNLSDYRTPT